MVFFASCISPFHIVNLTLPNRNTHFFRRRRPWHFNLMGLLFRMNSANFLTPMGISSSKTRCPRMSLRNSTRRSMKFTPGRKPRNRLEKNGKLNLRNCIVHHDAFLQLLDWPTTAPLGVADPQLEHPDDHLAPHRVALRPRAIRRGKAQGRVSPRWRVFFSGNDRTPSAHPPQNRIHHQRPGAIPRPEPRNSCREAIGCGAVRPSIRQRAIRAGPST